MTKKLVKFDEAGRRVGDSHPLAKISDRVVDQIRELAESGLGYRVLARKFELPKSTVRDIVKCRRRYATATVIRDEVVLEQGPVAPVFDPHEVNRKYLARREDVVQGLAAEYGVHREKVARAVPGIRATKDGVHQLSGSSNLKIILSASMRALGHFGGVARSSTLTAEQRQEIAKRAIESRWAKRKMSPRE